MLYSTTGYLTPTPPFDFAGSLDFLGGFQPTAGKLYNAGPPLSEAALRPIAERYGAWQGYWAHYLRVAS